MKKIPLTWGHFTLIDDENYRWLNQWKWYTRRTPYAGLLYAVRNIYISKGRLRAVLMHRLILGLQAGDKLECDHIDGNGLNNQWSNLRACTGSQNGQNRRKCNAKTTSKYKGICWHCRNNKWIAGIRVNGKLIHLGYFSDEKSAARAYNKAALKHFGGFSRINKI